MPLVWDAAQRRLVETFPNGSPVPWGLGGNASSDAPAAGVGVDPTSALAWFQAASPVLGKVLGGSSAGPSHAESSAYTNATFDNSGWTVATGRGNATQTPELPWAWILGAALVGLLIWKRA